MNASTLQKYKEFDQTNWSDADDVESALKVNGLFLVKVSSVLKRDKSLVKLAVLNTPLAIQFADDSLKDDLDIAVLACSGDFIAYRYISERLQKDPNIVQIVFPQFVSFYDYKTTLSPDEYVDVLRQYLLLSPLNKEVESGGS